VTGQGWSLRRFAERVLRVPARVVVHARRAVVVIDFRSATHWQQLCAALRELRWSPPPLGA
jgi:hypothetical protein